MEASTLLNALGRAGKDHNLPYQTRTVVGMGRLAFAIAVVLLFSACTGTQPVAVPEPDTPVVLETPSRPTASALPPTPDTTATTSTTAAPQTLDETPTTTTAAVHIELQAEPDDIQPVLSGTAAAPAPVEIIQPSPPIASFTTGALDEEFTISFEATGNGRIDWYSQIPPDGPLINRGKGSTIDITLFFPIDEDSFSYFITADGRNPRAGDDSITILLVRGSS